MTHPQPARPADSRPPRLAAAAQHLAAAYQSLRDRSPEESAQLAWVPGGPSVDELARRIRRRFTRTDAA